ncbi:MAG: WecB/TagA/CpsF family glycosyltransferase [Deltaproteobacteria bacterium]|nr:WecB/TagA/CpsF family glycosyltransferase [Deltaproteobacteria bacterium]
MQNVTQKILQLPQNLPLMTLQVTPFTDYAHACICVGELVTSGQKAFSVAINPEKLYKAEQDRELASLINQAQIFICDGIGAALAVRVLDGRAITRITGVALFYALVKKAAVAGWRIYLLGAAPEVNRSACERLLQDYPDLQIVGRHDGYFTDSEKIVDDINASGAEILFVAMGSPKQEAWIAGHRERINAAFCMGVGGTFDVVSGKVRWAPLFFRQTGTEWFYRLLSEPKRWRRQLALPKFLWLLVRYKLTGVRHFNSRANP